MYSKNLADGDGGLTCAYAVWKAWFPNIGFCSEQNSTPKLEIKYTYLYISFFFCLFFLF